MTVIQTICAETESHERPTKDLVAHKRSVADARAGEWAHCPL